MGLLFDNQMQWTALLGGSMFLFSLLWVKPNFGWAAAMFLFYSACSALYVYVFTYNRYQSLGIFDPATQKIYRDVYTQVNLKLFAADSLAKALIVTLPIMVAARSKWRFYDFGTVACALFALVNSLAVLGQYLFLGCASYNSCGGIVGNPSMSLGLTVCTLPFFMKDIRLQWPFLALITAAVFLSKSSVAIGLLAAFLVLWFLPWEKSKWFTA